MGTEQNQQLADTLEEIRQFLPRLINAAIELSDRFYAPMEDDTWRLLGDVLEAMDDLYRAAQTISTQFSESHYFSVNGSDMQEFSLKLSSDFQRMNQCTDQEDYVGAGDLFKFELIPLLQHLLLQLGESADQLNLRFRANLSYLEEHFPSVYNNVSNTEMNPECYRTRYSLNGEANLAIRLHNDDEIVFYSVYDPANEAAKWATANVPQLIGKKNVIIYGLGFGYHLKELGLLNQGHQYYVYEPDMQIFLAAMHHIDFHSTFAGIPLKGLAVGADKNTIDQFFYRFLRFMKGETATLSLSVYDRLDRDARRVFNQRAREAVLNYAYSQSLLQNAGMSWIRNILNNLSVNLDSQPLNGLRGKLSGITAVIVGAGPSLEKDIEVLKKLRNHALIIAAGTSVQSLLHFGIEPHLVVSIDGGVPNFNAFSHLNIEEMPMLYTPQLEYRIIEKKTNYLMHAFFTNDMITQVLMGVTQEEAVFASTHSVTGTAIQAAIFMGCEHVVFTGQDLSYPTKSVYAVGAKHVDEGHHTYIHSLATLQIENVHGGVNQTTESMILTLRDIEDLLAKYPTHRFTNSSSLGARIEHTVFRPLGEIEAELQSSTLEPLFFKQLMAKHLQNQSKDRIVNTINRTDELYTMVEREEQRLSVILKGLHKLPELSRTRPLKCLNAMISIEEDWEAVVKSVVFHTLFMIGLKAEINEFDRNVSDIAEEKDTIRKAKLFKQILEPLVVAMLERLPMFKEIIREARHRIDNRLGISARGVNN